MPNTQFMGSLHFFPFYPLRCVATASKISEAITSHGATESIINSTLYGSTDKKTSGPPRTHLQSARDSRHWAGSFFVVGVLIKFTGSGWDAVLVTSLLSFSHPRSIPMRSQLSGIINKFYQKPPRYFCFCPWWNFSWLEYQMNSTAISTASLINRYNLQTI